MNLLYTITSYPPATGGAQTHLHQLALQFQTRHNLRVAAFWNRNRTDWLLGTTLNAGPPGNADQLDGIPVHLLGWSPPEKISLVPAAALYYFLMPQIVPWIAAKLVPQLEQIDPQAQVVHNVRVGREPLSWASMLFARRKNIPFVFTPLHHPRWQGLRYRVFHDLYRQADALVALTHSEKEYLVTAGASEARVHVLGHGAVLAPSADPQAFIRANALSGPVILFLGQHYEYKGFRQLLQAAPLVWKKVPEAHFVFIGPPVRSSEKYFNPSPDPRILRLGAVDLQSKTDALAACTLLCVPSTQESFGGVYTEAWSFAKPVIGCPIPAVREVISEGEDGFLVDQQPGPIAERILYLLQHPDQAHQMGLKGQQKVSNRYSWDTLARRMETIYQALLQ